MNSSSRTSMADIVALICALVLLSGFFMPWFTIPFFNVSVSGWGILSLANAAANSPDVHADTSGVFWLVLVLVAAICATVAAIWGLVRPAQDRATSIGSALAGGVILAIFIGALLVMNAGANQSSGGQSGASQLNGSPFGVNGLNLALNFIGVGVWATLLGAIGLVVQVFFPRSAIDAYQPRTTHGHGPITSSRRATQQRGHSGMNEPIRTGWMDRYLDEKVDASEGRNASIKLDPVTPGSSHTGLPLSHAASAPLGSPSAVPAAAFCRACGAAPRRGEKFCRYCGSVLTL